MNRGDIFIVKWSFNGEEGGFRPVIVISDATQNKFLPTVLVAPLMSKIPNKLLPTHIKIDKGQGGLLMDSLAVIERSQLIDKSKLVNKFGSVNDDMSDKIVNALLFLLGTKKYSKAESEIEKEYTAFENELMKEVKEQRILILGQNDILEKINNPTIINKIMNATLNGTIKTLITLALGYLIAKAPLVLAYFTKVYQNFIKLN